MPIFLNREFTWQLNIKRQRSYFNILWHEFTQSEAPIFTQGQACVPTEQVRGKYWPLDGVLMNSAIVLSLYKFWFSHHPDRCIDYVVLLFVILTPAYASVLMYYTFIISLWGSQPYYMENSMRRGAISYIFLYIRYHNTPPCKTDS